MSENGGHEETSLILPKICSRRSSMNSNSSSSSGNLSGKGEVTLNAINKINEEDEGLEFSYPDSKEKRSIFQLTIPFPSVDQTVSAESRRHREFQPLSRKTEKGDLMQLVSWILKESDTILSKEDVNLCLNTLFKYKKVVTLKQNKETQDEPDNGSECALEIFVDPFQFAVLHKKSNALMRLLSSLDEVQKLEVVKSKARINISSKDIDSSNLDSEDLNIDNQTIFHIGAQYSSTCMDILLKKFREVNVFTILDGRERTVFHLAAGNKTSATLMLLHEFNPESGVASRMDKLQNTCLHYAVKFGTLDTTSYVIENIFEEKSTELDCCNKKGKSALFYAKDPKMIYYLLNNGLDPTVGKSDKGYKLLQHFLRKSPENARALLNYEVTTNEKEIGDNELLFIYNYRLFQFTPNPTRLIKQANQLLDKPRDNGEREQSHSEEMQIISSFLEFHKKEILNSPIAESFLHLKWLRTKKFFFFNLFLYSIYLLSMTSLIVGTSYMKYHDTCTTNIISGNLTCSFQEGPTTTLRDFTGKPLNYTALFLQEWKLHYFIIFLLLTITCTTTIIIREILQVINGGRKYFRSFENWLELTALLSTLLYTIIISLRAFTTVQIQDGVEQGIGAAAVFLAWIEMTLLIGRLPGIGIYTYMATQVIRQLIKFFSVYVTILIAFALAFTILLPKSPVYENPLTSFIAVLVMMIGEFGFEDSFTWDSVEQYGTSGSVVITQILFILFIFLVSVIIANLMIGLTVNDTRELFQEAEIYRLGKTILQIQEIESIFINGKFFKALRNSSVFSWMFPKMMEEYTKLFRILTENGKTRNTKICVKPLNFTEDVSQKAKNKEFKVYFYNHEKKKAEKSDKIKMQLPKWVVDKTFATLAEKRTIEDGLREQLASAPFRNEWDSFRSGSDAGNRRTVATIGRYSSVTPLVFPDDLPSSNDMIMEQLTAITKELDIVKTMLKTIEDEKQQNAKL